MSAPYRAICVAVLMCVSELCAAAPKIERLEELYADLNDAYGALGLIDSGAQRTYEDKDRAAWSQLYEARRRELHAALAGLSGATLEAADARAVQLMRETLDAYGAQTSQAPTRRCSDAQRQGLSSRALREALYACFDEFGNRIQFEGAEHTRVGAFDLLTRLDDPQRRKALFHAFTPLWRAVNGGNEPDSPYRRVIAMAAAEARSEGSAIDAAARTVGVNTAELEIWLTRVLQAWRTANPGEPIEPWDYRYAAGAADRALGGRIPLERMQPLNERFYADLGAELSQWSVIYDLQPRSGKAPLAYADYVRRGRYIGQTWRPTVVRVSANYARGGLGPMNELVHENGHVVHMMALRTRPAFMDLGDAVFYEAFADTPSWSVYEPAWQQKYLGDSLDERTSLRALYANVMLDVAWSLFELRMLRDPQRDPNALWTELTTQYLNVKPHPELSWWAVRVQLVDSPGYMINYGLGAAITADLRARIRDQLGPFDAGEPKWFAWLAERLLSSGYERETAQLLRDFLGRSVSVEPLLHELERMKGGRDE